MSFKDNIRRLRKEKEISQEILALRLNVTRQTISKWENGTAMPDLKKLTELADFFEVSMDDLLGTVSKKGNDENSYNIENISYIKSLINVINENQKILQHQQNKVKYSLISIVIIFAILFVIMAVNIQSNLTSMNNNLQNQITSIRDSFNADYSGDYTDYYEDYNYEILKTNSDKPNIISVKFTYSPKSYSKNSKVFFLLPNIDGNSDKLQAEENDGVFELITDFDLRAEGDIYIWIEEDDKINKQLMDINLLRDYRYISGVSSYSITILNQDNLKGNKSIVIDSDFGTEGIEWENTIAADITKVNFVVENNGKKIYTKDLKIQNSDDINKTSSPENVVIDNFTDELVPKSFMIYYQAIDKNGVEYRYYPPYMFNNIENAEEYYSDTDVHSIIFGIDKKEIKF